MNTVTLYTKPSCVQCNATYRKLDKHSIAFEKVDVSVDETALAYIKDDLGLAQAPVLVVTDPEGAVVEFWSGFNPTKIEALVGTVADTESLVAA